MILTHLVAFEFIPGAGDGSAPAAPTFNNSTQNWLSPSMHLALLLGALLYLRMIP